MIVQLRVDDRLVHGQVTLMWGKELSTKGILVANDAAAQNETQSSTLKMACPGGQKLLIRTIDDAIKIANDPRAGEMRIFALTGNIADALKLVKGAPGRIGSVNVANVGRFDRSDDAAKVLLTTGVTLNPDEVAAARELCEQDLPVFHQVGVTDGKVKVSDLLAKL